MAVSVDMQQAGDPNMQAEVRAVVEHVLADRSGDWRVSIIGSRANDRWELNITGPNAFERSYTLEGSAGSIDRRRSGLFWVRWSRDRPQRVRDHEERNINWSRGAEVNCSIRHLSLYRLGSGAVEVCSAKWISSQSIALRKGTARETRYLRRAS